MSTHKIRFEVLDSWRGICALFVALGHFCFYFDKSTLTLGPLIDQSFIFVDYFFVLSGFVISFSYLGKIDTGVSAIKFILIRLGRIYPLHAFLLVLLIGLEFVRSHIQHDHMFIDQTKSLASLCANFLLLHSMGLFDYLSWNIPSWSISVEFYTYITFAIIAFCVRPKLFTPLSIALVIAAPVLLLILSQKPTSDATYDYGFIRCIGGFFAGVLIYKLYARTFSRFGDLSYYHATIIELLLLAAVFLFALNIGENYLSFFSPLLFSICVYTFALEKGAISKALKYKPLVLLGTLSYSIYMTHAVVQRVMVNFIDIIEPRFGFNIIKERIESTDKAPYFDVTTPYALLFALLMILGTVIFSYGTYYIIERPSYMWAKCKISNFNKRQNRTE